MVEPRPIGYWLKLLDKLIDEQFASTLEEHGVTRRQWQLLNALSHSSATAAELDSTLGAFIDTAAGESSADHLGELVESEWVVLSAERYSITERGSTAFGKLAEVVERDRAAIAEGVSAEEYELTVGTLERMARNLGWVEPTG